MKYRAQQLKQRLFSLTNSGIKYDLERIRAAAEESGNLNLPFPSIHVAGTNGKGSTCTYVESVLRADGYKTGLFTSPHIVRFEERFRINGSTISEQMWISAYDRIKGVASDYKLSFFEVTMLMACEIFREAKVDWGIFETGMGGRLDATNIITPEVVVITHISLDHCEYLGSTLVEIAAEKAGIIKSSVPVIAAQNYDEEVNTIIRNVCVQKNAPLLFVSPDNAVQVNEKITGTDFIYRNDPYTISMKGTTQISNSLLAIEALKVIDLPSTKSALHHGLQSAHLEGRFEVMEIRGKRVVLDVAHNRDAIENLCKLLKLHFKDEDIVIIVGIMSDKEFSAMMKMLEDVAAHVVVTKPSIERAADPELLAACLSKKKCTLTSDVTHAVKYAFTRNEMIICATGSFYTVGEVSSSLDTIMKHP